MSKTPLGKGDEGFARALERAADHQIDLAGLSSLALLRLYADTLTTLNTRGVVRSRNAPAGDLSEYLTAAVYRGSLAPASEKSWDVRASDGRLLQVKSRVLEPSRQAGNYSPFRSWDFHTGVFVHFDAFTYEVISAIEVPVDTIRALTTPDQHVGTQARRLTVGTLSKARAAAAVAEAADGTPSPYLDQTEAFAGQMLHLSEK